MLSITAPSAAPTQASNPVSGSVPALGADELVAPDGSGVVPVLGVTVGVDGLTGGAAVLGAGGVLVAAGGEDVVFGGGVECDVVLPASGSVYWLSPADGPLASASVGASASTRTTTTRNSLNTRRLLTSRVSQQYATSVPSNESTAYGNRQTRVLQDLLQGQGKRA